MQPTQLSSRAIERPRFSFESKTFRLTRLQRDWLDFRCVRMKLNLKKRRKKRKQNDRNTENCYCDGFGMLYYWIGVFICKARKKSRLYHILEKELKIVNKRRKKMYLARFRDDSRSVELPTTEGSLIGSKITSTCFLDGLRTLLPRSLNS